MNIKKTLRNTIIKGLTVLVLATAGCGKPQLPVDHVSKHYMFGDDVKVTRTETTQRYIGDNWIKGIKLEFDINKPGNYLFEGWVNNYRAPDSLGERWRYKVEEVPYHEERDLESLIYRLEATRVTNNEKIERASIKFQHKGIASAYGVQGKPIAR